MREIGGYCKAYLVDDCRKYPQWVEVVAPVEAEAANGDQKLSDDDLLFLHENFKLTRGIYMNEDIVFDRVTPEWIEFCTNTLNFKPPSEANGTDNEPQTI